ncbi:GIY-YIG nuclease family protein [Undibacterium sp.]|uniref:GIY-YIG nuclease family protein n=1 Tax=Undibacterium sp. TaxID=1914977 RepID=UPI003753500A
MKIEIKWSKPIVLVQDKNLIYSLSVLESVSDLPGIYVFARKYGDSLTPLYVGKANSLLKRVKGQLNNVKLMMQVKNWEKNGGRVLLVGYVANKGNQDIDKVLGIVESTLIEHFLAEGHPLVNIQGTKKQVHELTFRGNRFSETIAPRSMYVEAKK